MIQRNKQSQLLRQTVQSVGASATAQVVSEAFAIAPRASLNFRFSVYVGLATAGAGITAQLQQADAYEIWNAGKAGVAITSSTDVAVTVTAATDNFNAVAHGFVQRQAVVVDGNTVPTGFAKNTIYYVYRVGADDFKLATTPANADQGIVIDATSAGVAVTVTAVRQFTQVYDVEDTTNDKAHMPLMPQGRIVVNSGAGSSVIVLNVTVDQL